MSEEDELVAEVPEPPLREIPPDELTEILERHRVWLATDGRDGERADLSRTDLRDSGIGTADLQGADLSRADLGGVFLAGASFQGASLRNADLSGASLYIANLGGADLRSANLEQADFNSSLLRNADLTDATLEGAKGLLAGQLAGTILTGTGHSLSKDISDGFSTALSTVEEAAKNARKLLFGLLLGCVYSGLTIATTTDARLLPNTTSSPLPIIGTEIPIAGFYWAAPVFLLAVYFYLHINLQHLWGLLARLPAVFPDGIPLDEKAYPWLLTGLVRIHVPRLRHVQLPALARLRAFLAVVLAWWVVPVTMSLFWLRYVPRHDGLGTSLHAVLLVLATASAVMLSSLARRTLQGQVQSRRSLVAADGGWRGHFRVAAVLLTAALVAVISYEALSGGPNDVVPKAFSSLGYGVFADLREATVSLRPTNFVTIRPEERDDFVRGADLRRMDLRHIDASGAFLQRARLGGADLTGADLGDASMTSATLTGATLDGARLLSTNLTKADLSDSSIAATFFDRADLNDVLIDAILTSGASVAMTFDRSHFRETGIETILSSVGAIDDPDLRTNVAFRSRDDLTDTELATIVIVASIADPTNAELLGTPTRAYLSSATIIDANLTGTNLIGANLREATLTKATLTDCILLGADLSGASLNGAILVSSNLNYADLTKADLTGADLGVSTLIHATLRGATLASASLPGANLRHADLAQADLTDAFLSADLTGANLEGAILSNAGLQFATVSQAQLDLACGDASTRLPDGLTIPFCSPAEEADSEQP